MNKNFALLILLALSLFWTFSLFIAPLSLEPGTIMGLDGYANSIDYEHKWDTLPSYQKAVYYFGDLNCHQMWYRSFSINDNQMPVDARMTSIFVFANLGLVMILFAVPSLSLSETIFNCFPAKFRKLVINIFKPEIFVAVIIILAMLPVAIDGFYQLLTPYESTNLKRVLTGIPTGWASGLIFGALISQLTEVRKYVKQNRQ